MRAFALSFSQREGQSEKLVVVGLKGDVVRPQQLAVHATYAQLKKYQLKHIERVAIIVVPF